MARRASRGAKQAKKIREQRQHDDHRLSEINEEEKEETLHDAQGVAEHYSDSESEYQRHSSHTTDRSSSTWSDSQRSRGVLTEQSSQNRSDRRISDHLDSTNMAGTRSKTKAEKEVERLQALLAVKEKENAEYKATVSSLAKKGKKSSGKSARIPTDENTTTAVLSSVSETLWRNTKFLVSDAELSVACKEVMADLPQFRKLLDPVSEDVEENVEAFVKAFGTTILTTINEKRTTAQSGLRKAWLARARKGLSLPTPPQLLEVIKRQDLEFDELNPDKNKERREWHLWYWDELLPKVAGQKRWGYSIRNYGCIASHSPPGENQPNYITSSDEALVIILYENCAQRWPYQYECESKNKEVDKGHKRYTAKYSDSATGQTKWGGWNLEGRTRYGKFRDKIARAKRKNPQAVKAVEKVTLKALRTLNGLNKSKTKKRKGRVAKDFEGKAEAEVVFVESDEESFKDEDEGSDIEEFDNKFPEPKKKKAKKSSESDDDDDDSEDDE